MKTKHFFLILFIYYLLANSCTLKSIVESPEKLCMDFYKLNQQTDMEPLLNTSILSLREYSVYDEHIEKVKRISLYISITDIESGEYVNFPAYSHFGKIPVSEKLKYYNRCDSLCISYLKKHNVSNQSLFSNYCRIIDSVYQCYLKIKLPKELPYENIPINGDGIHIEFVLYKDRETGKCYSCYYFKDSTVNLPLKKHLIKIDSHWYYTIY